MHQQKSTSTVPRKTKKDSATAEVPQGESKPAESPAKTAAAAPKKTARGTKTSAKKTSSKKSSSRGAAKKTPAKSAAAPSGDFPEPTDEEIQLRAYFLAERRAQLSLEGDANRDWLDAKQQLMEEARQARA